MVTQDNWFIFDKHNKCREFICSDIVTELSSLFSFCPIESNSAGPVLCVRYHEILSQQTAEVG